MEYIIVGDKYEFTECLLFVCGTKENAERLLEELTTNLTPENIAKVDGHKNLKIKAVESKDCWWRYGCD